MTRRVDVLNWTLPVSSSSFLLLLLLLLLLQRRTTEQETGGSCSFSDDAGHLDDKRATTHTHTHTHTHTYTHTNSEDRLRVAQPPTLGVPFKQSASRGGYGGGAVGTWFWLFLKKKNEIAKRKKINETTQESSRKSSDGSCLRKSICPFKCRFRPWHV